MNAIILYDEFDCATKANAMLARAARRADETTRWNVKPWRVNLLTLTGMADEALVEATDAHVIVFAVRSQAGLPPWLLDWLEQWAGCRQVQEAALAVFGGGNANTLSAPAIPELSHFAERHGLSFIFDDVVPTEDESAVFTRKLHEREVSMTPTPGHILDEPNYDQCRDWGINE